MLDGLTWSIVWLQCSTLHFIILLLQCVDGIWGFWCWLEVFCAESHYDRLLFLSQVLFAIIIITDMGSLWRALYTWLRLVRLVVSHNICIQEWVLDRNHHLILLWWRPLDLILLPFLAPIKATMFRPWLGLVMAHIQGRRRWLRCLTVWWITWDLSKPRAAVVEATEPTKDWAHTVVQKVLERISFLIIWGHISFILIVSILFGYFLGVYELLVLLLEDVFLLFLTDPIWSFAILLEQWCLLLSVSSSCWWTCDVTAFALVDNSG